MTRGTPCEFRTSVLIGAPVEAVFAFHADPENIRQISPAWQTVSVQKGGSAEVGGEFAIEVLFLGALKLRWRGRWREVSAPRLLVDEALQSPFAYWRHEHMFERVDAQTTQMTDHVTYALTGGWLGKALGETAVRVQFAVMFADRHARTRRALERRAV